MVNRVIELKASQLVLQPQSQQTAIHSNAWTIHNHLASLQTLLMYQIIRLFDGDIHLRADAERNFGTLAEWTESLHARTRDIVIPISSGRSSEASKPPDWYTWLFSESIRRTLLTSLMLRGVYTVLKDGFCNLSLAIESMRWTAQAALWNADSAFAWRRAWDGGEKRHFAMSFMDFEELRAWGKPEDVEELGLMMFVSFQGTDRVNEWMERCGGRLIG